MRANPLHHQHRLAMVGELSRKADATKQTLYDELRKHEGAVGVLGQALKCVDSHKSYVRKDLEEEKIDQAEAKIAMQRIDEIMGILGNLREQARINQVMIEGRHAQAGDFMSLLRVSFEEEKRIVTNAIQALEQARLDNGGEEPEVPDGHPGPGLAAKRRAEMHAVPVVEGETQDEPSPAEPDGPEDEAVAPQQDVSGA